MKLLSATKTSQKLDVSVATLTRWYQWYNETADKPTDTPVLPPYSQAGVRAPRYWHDSDIVALKAFKAWVKPGCCGIMGDVTQRYHRKKKE